MHHKIIAMLGIMLVLTAPAVLAQELPRFPVYNSMMVQANASFSETCYPAGEIMAVYPDNKCCEGLEQLPLIDEAQAGCGSMAGAVLCSDCGNGRCEYGENKCNCPEDCTPDPDATHSAGSAAECSDHFDNSMDGFCDAATKEGYCLDGSHLGDEKCRSAAASETAACVPSPEVCDGFDNDCDGLTDDGLTETRPCGFAGGECRKGSQSRACTMGAWGHWGNCENVTYPSREVCDGKDNNCDGRIDEYCIANATEPQNNETGAGNVHEQYPVQPAASIIAAIIVISIVALFILFMLCGRQPKEDSV
jgi:hypothetical protein